MMMGRPPGTRCCFLGDPLNVVVACGLRLIHVQVQRPLGPASAVQGRPLVHSGNSRLVPTSFASLLCGGGINPMNHFLFSRSPVPLPTTESALNKALEGKHG